MYTLLFILGAAAVVYLLVGSIALFRKQQRSNSTLDKGAAMNTVKHPVAGNPIFILYLTLPLLAVVLAIIWIAVTQ